jgi:hypothetical protein
VEQLFQLFITKPAQSQRPKLHRVFHCHLPAGIGRSGSLWSKECQSAFYFSRFCFTQNRKGSKVRKEVGAQTQTT